LWPQLRRSKLDWLRLLIETGPRLGRDQRGGCGGVWVKLERHDADLSPKPRGARRDQRRVIGFIGNCQAELLQRAFQCIVPADRIHSFYHFYEISTAEREKARADLDLCDDLLIQDIQNSDDYPLRDGVRAATRVTRFPFLWFAAPWPYDDFNGLRDIGARSQDDPALHTTTYYDGVLGRLRRLGIEPQARLAVYRALDVPGLVRPERILDFEVRRLEAQDARFGIGTGKFILENFRKLPLFHTAINSICHLVGERSFDRGDNSRNNTWLGLVTWGEAHHNNHHAFSNSAAFGLRWFELDPGFWFIRFLQSLGLVWDVRRPAQTRTASSRKAQA
jgi:hypothetical protein